MSNTPTPRTDGNIFPTLNPKLQYVSADFARQLERELADVMAKLEKAEKDLMYHKKLCVPKTLDELEAVNLRSLVQDMESDLDTARRENAALREALQPIADDHAKISRSNEGRVGYPQGPCRCRVCLALSTPDTSGYVNAEEFAKSHEQYQQLVKEKIDVEMEAVKMEEQIAALQADKERLDWLEERLPFQVCLNWQGKTYLQGAKVPRMEPASDGRPFTGPTLRAAIDGAKGEQP